MNEFKKPVPFVPGCTFVEYVTNEKVNGGAAVPLFEPAASRINTIDGWNAAAYKQNVRSFTIAHGRPPMDMDELYTWVYSLR